MRILLLALYLSSFSSCLALLGAGAITATAATSSSQGRRAAARREAQLRVVHAQEAAVIRQRYNAEQQQTAVTTQAPVQLVETAPLEPTAPPLLATEPARVPIRPRAR